MNINWRVFLILPCMLLTFIAGIWLGQYIPWIEANGFADLPPPTFFTVKDIIADLHTIPGLINTVYGIAICIIVFVLLMQIAVRLTKNKNTEDTERNLTYSDKGTYGTAGFMTEKEFHRVLEFGEPGKTKGTILGTWNGQTVCLPEKTFLNRNIAVFGASGTLKSRAFARNMILQAVMRGESIVITDPKSELYEDTALYLQSKGYEVKQFNLVNHSHSDAWNCMTEVAGDEVHVQMMCDIIIKNTGGAKGDHFWDNSEMNLLKALSLYVMYEYPEDKRNLGEVYNLILRDITSLETLFRALPVSHPATAPFMIYKQATESIRGSIVIGLGSRLQVFQNQLIREMTSESDIDLERPGKTKCAYFCIMSDQNSTFDFLSSLFFAFLFIRLVGYADRECVGCKLDVPVMCILDEFPNIGQIPDFCKKISTVRSRGIGISVIFQNLAQLQNRYPENQWQEIIGNCDTQLFLGCTDQLTAEYISERTGDVTIAVSSQAKQLSTVRLTDYTPEYRESSSVGKRALMTPDEVMRLPREDALLFIRGQKVLKVKKFDYTRHPESRKFKPSKATDHIPKRIAEESAKPQKDFKPKPNSDQPKKPRQKSNDIEVKTQSVPPTEPAQQDKPYTEQTAPTELVLTKEAENPIHRESLSQSNSQPETTAEIADNTPPDDSPTVSSEVNEQEKTLIIEEVDIGGLL